jgi:hypothetical protein
MHALSDLKGLGHLPTSARHSGEPPPVTHPEVERSLTVLAAKLRGVSARAVIVVLAFAAGLGAEAGGGDDPPMQKILDQIHTRNRPIGKRLRYSTALEATDRVRMADNAATPIRLGTEARELTEPARERKKSQQDWARAASDFLRAADEFNGVIADPRTSQPRAAQSYKKASDDLHQLSQHFPREGGLKPGAAGEDRGWGAGSGSVHRRRSFLPIRGNHRVVTAMLVTVFAGARLRCLGLTAARGTNHPRQVPRPDGIGR